MHLRALSLAQLAPTFVEVRVKRHRYLIAKLSESKAMRDVMELLRAKEQELLKVKRQVEALRIAAPLLGDDGDRVGPSATQMVAKGTRNLE
jgi:hypothetical protein